MSWDPWRFLRDPDGSETDEYDVDAVVDRIREEARFGDET